MSDIGDRNAVLRSLDLIHAHHQPRLRIFDIPVRIHNACGVLKDRLDLLRNLGLTSQVRAVDFRNQCLDHRRPRRYFAHLDARPIRVADRVEQRTKPLGNGMALHAALLGRQQVHLDVGLIRLAAHVVVAHQSVEVIRPGCSGVRLVVQHVRLPSEFISQRLGHARRLLKGSAVGHVDDHLEFALVIERQHLYFDES